MTVALQIAKARSRRWFWLLWHWDWSALDLGDDRGLVALAVIHDKGQTKYFYRAGRAR